jgi:hypothetical protein
MLNFLIFVLTFYHGQKFPTLIYATLFLVKRMDIYYCGFNGFKQVPVGASSDTLTCLTLHTKGAQVRLGKDPTEHKFLVVF